MNTYDKKELDAIYLRRKFLLRLKVGLFEVIHNKNKAVILGLLLLVMVILWKTREKIIYEYKWDELQKIACSLNLLVLFMFILIGYLFFNSQPIFSWKIHRKVLCAGIINHAGEPPVFLNKRKERNGLFVMCFESIGIPLEQWEKKRQEIESSLNISISEIRMGKNRYVIEVVGIDGIYNYKENIWWKNDYFMVDNATFRVGENMRIPVEFSLSMYSHLLIGGATGSGKTILLKLLLLQCVKKRYLVFIADFKGGADYLGGWKECCKLIYERDRVVEVMKEIDKELQKRKRIFRELECRDIDEYNQRNIEKLPRIIFACDEVAELLNISNLEKAEVEQTKEIRRYMTRIACIGRAFGIHLFLATQRPDADVLQGQIKNNIDYRICGKADSVLSKIILDNTDAATLLPNNAKGVFINHEGIVFKSYIYDDKAFWK